jgi:hypothetical protein
MADDDSAVGFTLHSNFARHYAAARRENPLGHGERTLDHIAFAQAVQQDAFDAARGQMLERDARWDV